MISMPQLRAKKMLLVISSLGAGGAERIMSELANAWAVQGAHVGLLTLAMPEKDYYPLSPDVERIALNEIGESHSLLQTLTNNARRCWKIRRAVRRFAPDVVVSFIEQNNVRVLAALMGTGIPVVVSERIDPRHYDAGRAFGMARRWLYPFAHRLVVQTENIATDWAYSVVSSRKVAVIPNAVREMSETLPCAERDSCLILAVGRLHRQKGFDILLKAFARSDLAGRGARLVILGEGAERASLEELARSLNIAQAVSMPGVVRDPESWMARCALFVMTSRYEGFPNVLLEAMSMRCAVIAADCDSGPREMIRHEHNGLLVPVEDEEATAEAMQRLFDDVEMRERLGEAAVEVRERFSREKSCSSGKMLFWMRCNLERIEGWP
jgi:glycosyltransferase involved in cell wall biosynthesis